MVDSYADNPNPHRPRNLFDIKREPHVPRPLSEPDPNFVSGAKHETTPKTDQETLFRAAAIKCAEMEQTLFSYVENQPLKDSYSGKKSFMQNGVITTQFPTGDWATSTSAPFMGPIFDDYSTIELKRLGEVYSELGTLAKVKTPFALTIEAHMDQDTRKYFEEFKSNSHAFINNKFKTMYFFNDEGDFAKLSFVPNTFETPSEILKVFPHLTDEVAKQHMNAGKPLPIDGGKVYKSKVTEDDFEIAGQALQILINKLKPQVEKPAE